MYISIKSFLKSSSAFLPAKNYGTHLPKTLLTTQSPLLQKLVHDILSQRTGCEQRRGWQRGPGSHLLGASEAFLNTGLFRQSEITVGKGEKNISSLVFSFLFVLTLFFQTITCPPSSTSAVNHATVSRVRSPDPGMPWAVTSKPKQAPVVLKGKKNITHLRHQRTTHSTRSVNTDWINEYIISGLNPKYTQ